MKRLSVFALALGAALLCTAPGESQTLLMHQATCDPANPNNCVIPYADGSQQVASGRISALNIAAPTVVKAAPGRIARVSVIVAGSTAGTINDTTTTGGASAANQVFTIPNTVGTYDLEWPMLVGIVVITGTGQTVAVSYN